MMSTVFLFSVATTLVLTNPQRIPAWLLVGAVVSAVFTVYYTRKSDKDPLYLLINSIATLFMGVAAPRPVLHYFGVVDLEYWYPETFILLGTIFGMSGFTILHTLYLLITGELPGIIRRAARAITDRIFPPKPDSPP